MLDVWRAFLEYTPDLMFIKDTDLVYLAFQIVAETHGFASPDDVSARQMTRFDDHELHRDILIRKANTGKRPASGDYIESVRSHDGVQKYCQVKICYPRKSGRPVGIAELAAISPTGASFCGNTDVKAGEECYCTALQNISVSIGICLKKPTALSKQIVCDIQKSIVPLKSLLLTAISIPMM